MADPFHLAEANVALPREPGNTEALDSFFDLSAAINAAADSSPGFIWRPEATEEDLSILGNSDLLITMSVWRSVADLRRFVYNNPHMSALRRRREWFADLGQAHMVLWWIPAGILPTLAEAESRLIHLRRHGPTPYAFHLTHPYPPTLPATANSTSEATATQPAGDGGTGGVTAQPRRFGG